MVPIGLVCFAIHDLLGSLRILATSANHHSLMLPGFVRRTLSNMGAIISSFVSLVRRRPLPSLLPLRPKPHEKLSANSASIQYAHHTSRIMEQLCFLAGNNINLREAILLDTGCSQHIFTDEKVFDNIHFYRPSEKSRSISGIGNTILQPIGVGNVTLNLSVNNTPHRLTLTGCLFCPTLGANLVSGSQLI